MSVIEHGVDAEGVMTITFNRPEKLNAMNTEMLYALDELFSVIKEKKEVKAVLLTGKGKAFCAGVDINRLLDCDAQTGYEFACAGQRVFRKLETLGKPSLAAINGYAFGGGCELSMAATLRIASVDAQFGQPEVKLGVIPGYGGTQRLARLVGKGRALDLCLTGRFIDAQTALNWGLVSAVYENDKLIEESKGWLSKILSMGPLAIASTMEAIDHGYDMSLTDALHLEAVHFGKACGSRDKTEGVSAFLEKRRARFSGE